MNKKEEKAREYADGLMNSVKSYYVEKYGMERAKRMSNFDIYYVEQAYLDGWDAMLGGLLTNVKERQPDPNEEVVCRMVSNGAFVSGYIYQEDGKYKVATSPDFHFEDYGDYECDYWFPKPKLIEVNHG